MTVFLNKESLMESWNVFSWAVCLSLLLWGKKMKLRSKFASNLHNSKYSMY